MRLYRQRYGQGADQAEVTLRPLDPLAVQLLVLELGRTLFARLLVPLAVCLLAVHAAVLDEAAGRAVPELDGVAPVLTAVCADTCSFARRVVLHCRTGVGRLCCVRVTW